MLTLIKKFLKAKINKHQEETKAVIKILNQLDLGDIFLEFTYKSYKLILIYKVLLYIIIL